MGLGEIEARREEMGPAQPVGDDPEAALDLIFGEGELTIEAAAAGGDGPAVIRARGTGRPGSPVADFVYDYIFFPVADSPGAVDQRKALVGTVMRAADHGAARKGAVAFDHHRAPRLSLSSTS